jgi:predicted phosphodiesterase
MRYLVLSDIHANVVALEAVLKDAETRRWDRVIFLGDVVGYYPQPEEAVAMLRELDPAVTILGNHDAILLALACDPELKPQSLVERLVARQLKDLSQGSVSYIEGFRLHHACEAWEAAHGALREPFEYLSSLPQAQANLPYMTSDLCFVGHTHVPLAFACVMSARGPLWRSVPFRREANLYRLPPQVKVFLNPGSVGQPRDGLPLASYALYDEDHGVVEVLRVPFDIAKVQRLVRERGYPEALAARLAEGR